MDKFHTDITQIGNLINSLITDLEEKYLGRNVYVEMYTLKCMKHMVLLI